MGFLAPVELEFGQVGQMSDPKPVCGSREGAPGCIPGCPADRGGRLCGEAGPHSRIGHNRTYQ
jgi:hypothetical protein